VNDKTALSPNGNRAGKKMTKPRRSWRKARYGMVLECVCVCKNQAETVIFGPILNFLPETENFSHPYFHAAA
jgi:hypothetical protein